MVVLTLLIRSCAVNAMYVCPRSSQRSVTIEMDMCRTTNVLLSRSGSGRYVGMGALIPYACRYQLGVVSRKRWQASYLDTSYR